MTFDWTDIKPPTHIFCDTLEELPNDPMPRIERPDPRLTQSDVDKQLPPRTWPFADTEEPNKPDAETDTVSFKYDRQWTLRDLERETDSLTSKGPETIRESAVDTRDLNSAHPLTEQVLLQSADPAILADEASAVRSTTENILPTMVCPLTEMQLPPTIRSLTTNDPFTIAEPKHETSSENVPVVLTERLAFKVIMSPTDNGPEIAPPSQVEIPDPMIKASDSETDSPTWHVL